ncbi:LysR family transcriptional regulator [Reinekea forsetii]|uniref:Transcriptional regulator, LysR family n=1 Tax=Reinekea forsetii TaxID=1336806 RepID=A0A2K8KNY7_9GAMM|nr:LysR family transcriptional regulator [Reinekea forsetii]ATX76500.1 transcriptional regulator, LysR family [Reinekea forsetii]
MKDINEKRVKYLYEAVQQGTVRAAADKLNVSPSAVSRQIALLEEELATTLIERHRTGVTVTEAGAVVLTYYRELRSHQEECLSKLNSLHGLQSGHINLAVGEGFVGDLMSDPLPEFNRRFPNLTLSVTTGGTNKVMRLIEEDQAHVGLVFHPPNQPSIRTQVKKRQPLCVIVAPGHPLLLLGRPVTLHEAQAYPYALQDGQFGIRQLLAIVEFKERIRLSPQVTTNSIGVLTHFVRSKMGVTFLPAFVVAREVADGQLFAIAIEHPILASGEAHMITRLGRQLPEGPLMLLQHLKTWMRAFKSGGD